jgi:replicative DNA helicase
VNTVEIAERASLGALLLEPGQIALVSLWLRESDYLHPRSRITYRLLTAVASQTGPVGPHDLLGAALADPQARRNHVAGPYLHELLASPGGPGRAAVYARMVLHASVVRSLTERALELAHMCQHTEQVPESVPALLDAITDTCGCAHALQGRLDRGDPGHGQDPRELAEPGDPHAPSVPDRSGLEAELVSALQDNPWVVERIRAWLVAEDFATAEHAGAYASMLALASQGLPIDHVTTQWNRRDRYALCDAIPAHVAATRSRCTSHETLRLARQLLGKALATRTQAATGAIAHRSQDPRLGARQQLGIAMRDLERARTDAARWLEAGLESS